ncbi:MAG: thioesterase family protein [Bacteroidetes bacterium]|nr:thioesterase family protein [Bacteroidota bacterium]MBP7399513.1 thioesterase family protein [Chitinophagales bacterium]MBK7110735.1 thioesterase family protein [Bacteroidota bacterium]MBK8488049.1 thioesterase family protein [Bacteroidota bacterium]MBK8682195.1 thioesterase family protein [Bacteroidota bacterium]
MTRIHIEQPEKYLFKTEIAVRITDLNYGNHLANDSMLSIIHEARVQFLYELGYSEKDVEGTGLIMGDVAIQYKAEAFYGEILQIEIGVSDITRVAFDIIYKIQTQNKLIAIAKTGMVCYDYTNKKIANVPLVFKEKIDIDN